MKRSSVSALTLKGHSVCSCMLEMATYAKSPLGAAGKLTDAEIIERFIVPARNAIERRRDGSKVVLRRMPTTHAEAKALLQERGYEVAEDDNGAPLVTKDCKDADYKALPYELRTAWNVLSVDEGELAGLTARRVKESALYLSGEPEPMPQDRAARLTDLHLRSGPLCGIPTSNWHLG